MRRPDQQRLRYYAAGVRHARKIMGLELAATARVFNDEIEQLRSELRELRAQVERKREIERAIEAEHQGWLQ
jgi:predicted RNase H-like nuclease (RuvC/YqgF family)